MRSLGTGIAKILFKTSIETFSLRNISSMFSSRKTMGLNIFAFFKSVLAPESLASQGEEIDRRSQSFLSILTQKERLPLLESKKHDSRSFLSSLLAPEKLPTVNAEEYTGNNFRSKKTSNKTPSGKIS